jgi:ATP-dependent protease ClpP protease subunit
MGKAKSKNNKFEDYVLTCIEDFHRFNVFPPTRTIKLESETSDDGEEMGVSHSMSNYFLKNIAILESMNHDPITVILNTYGGDIFQGIAIYDAIKASPCHVTIKVYGSAMSMGSIILQAGDERVMMPNASLMFHDGSSGSGGNSYESKNMAEFNRIAGQRFDTILFDRINEKRDKDNKARMARKTFDDMCLRSKWMFAEETVDMGLADRIESLVEKS